MLILKSTHDRIVRKLKREAQDADCKFISMLEKYNRLVELINSKGGQAFLDHGSISQRGEFSPDEIRTLLSLCHPDKHGGRDAANRMTQRLIEIRGTLH